MAVCLKWPFKPMTAQSNFYCISAIIKLLWPDAFRLKKIQKKKKEIRAEAETRKEDLKRQGIDVEGANLLEDTRDEDLLFDD